MDNKLSIHFGEDKTKSTLFVSKFKRKNFGEAMTLNVVNKINMKLKFLYRKNSFLISVLRGLLRNALIQPHFDYACSAWYPYVTKK